MKDTYDAVSVLRRRPARRERDDRAGGGDTENQSSHLASLPFAVGCGSPRICPEQGFSKRRRLQSLSKVCRVLTGANRLSRECQVSITNDGRSGRVVAMPGPAGERTLAQPVVVPLD